MKTYPSVRRFAKIYRAAKIPIALRQTVKTKLDESAPKVISPVHEPTDWVSQMAIVIKTNGDIRIYIDPQPLNIALKREHYKLPVLDDIMPDLSHAKIFSKLDVKEAYWHVALDEASSNLTTMITPFGRYKWNRLPFGLKVSSEIFQKKLVAALAGLKGVFAVADDVIVINCGETEKKAMENHEKNLTNLQERCRELGIVTKKLRLRTYIVRNPQGTTFRRNRVHMRTPRDYKEPDIHHPAPCFPSLGLSSAEALTHPTASEEANPGPRPEIPLLSNRPSREHKMPARFENFVMY